MRLLMPGGKCMMKTTCFSTPIAAAESGFFVPFVPSRARERRRSCRRRSRATMKRACDTTAQSQYIGSHNTTNSRVQLSPAPR